MRPVLTMPFLVLTLAAPCFAQSDDFNPYQAVLDGMPLEQAEPLIVDAYGPARERYSGINKPYDGGPVLVMMLGSDSESTLFLFCQDRLAAFSARITPNVAAAILRPLTRPGTDITIFPHEAGVWFETPDRTVSIDYRGVGTKDSKIVASYPEDVVLNLNFAARCDEVAPD